MNLYTNVEMKNYNNNTRDYVSEPFAYANYGQPNLMENFITQVAPMYAQFKFLYEPRFRRLTVYDTSSVSLDQKIAFVYLESRASELEETPILRIESVNWGTVLRGTKILGKAVDAFGKYVKPQTLDEATKVLGDQVNSYVKNETSTSQAYFREELRRIISMYCRKLTSLPEVISDIFTAVGDTSDYAKEQVDRIHKARDKYVSGADYMDAYDKDSYILYKNNEEQYVVVHRQNGENEPARVVHTEQMPEWMLSKIAFLKMRDTNAEILEGVGKVYNDKYILVLGE